MRLLFVYIFLMSLSACSFASSYQRPDQGLKPNQFKEAGPWVLASPNLKSFDQEKWWKSYHDTDLNCLEEKLEKQNESLKESLAKYDQARAMLSIAKADYFPTLHAVGNLNRQSVSQRVATLIPRQTTYDDVMIGANFAYEVDVFGRVRNHVARMQSLSNASAVDVAVMKLTLETMLASTYFSIRDADKQLQIYRSLKACYKQALEIEERRFKAGASSLGQVAKRQKTYRDSEVKIRDITLSRQKYEHALAVLIGLPPSCFSLPVKDTKLSLIMISPNLPSTLLERRPDIVEAEYKMQAANANIGVARAAYFPAINFWSSIAYESNSFSNLIEYPAMVWAVGPSGISTMLNNGAVPLISQILFDGGRVASLTDKAKAEYIETVSHYRQVVLDAYREVEDSLSSIRQLDEAYEAEKLAYSAANQAYLEEKYRQQAKVVTYLDVLPAQVDALSMQSHLNALVLHRQLASLNLIKALGGGWKNPSANKAGCH